MTNQRCQKNHTSGNEWMTVLCQSLSLQHGNHDAGVVLYMVWVLIQYTLWAYTIQDLRILYSLAV